LPICSAGLRDCIHTCITGSLSTLRFSAYFTNSSLTARSVHGIRPVTHMYMHRRLPMLEYTSTVTATALKPSPKFRAQSQLLCAYGCLLFTLQNPVHSKPIQQKVHTPANKTTSLHTSTPHSQGSDTPHFYPSPSTPINPSNLHLLTATSNNLCT